MNNVNAITREDLIARLSTAVGILHAIYAAPDTNWCEEQMLKDFLSVAFAPSKAPDCCPVVGGSYTDEVTKK